MSAIFSISLRQEAFGRMSGGVNAWHVEHI
jgi:hypothetical protein